MILLIDGVLHSNFQLTVLRNNAEITVVSNDQLRSCLKDTVDFFKSNIMAKLDDTQLDGLATENYSKYTVEKNKEYVEVMYANKIAELNSTLDINLKYFDAAIIFNASVFSLALDDEKEQLQKSLDFEAGKTRAKIVSEGTFVGEEYLLVHAESVAWIDAGSVEEDVPETVSVWAIACSITNVQAAENIIQTRLLFNQLLTTIRTIRLLGKADIVSAPTSVDANTAYKTALTKLSAIGV